MSSSSLPGSSTATAEAEAQQLARWQRKLLPLMVRLLVGLAIFFFSVSLVQMSYLAWRIELSPKQDLGVPVSLLARTAPTSSAEAIDVAYAMSATAFEANALERRYHQASVVLMARVWTSYLGFVTGMILSLIGAAFTLGRIQGSATTIETKIGTYSGSLVTSLPGLVLVALGVVLMIATLFVHYDIRVSDAAVYTAAPTPRSGNESSSGVPKVDFPLPNRKVEEKFK